MTDDKQRRDGGRGRRRAAGRRARLRGARARLRRGAPRRGRPRAHRRDAPQHGARHGRGGPRPVPGREARHRPRDRRTASTTTSSCRARSTPDDLETIEARMRAEREGRPPVRPQGAAVRRGEGDRRARGTGLQGRDPRRPQGEGRGRRRAAARHDVLRARPVPRPVPGPPRRVHREDRPVQAARGLRRLLARRPGARVDAAHLRHGLGDAGGARPVPVATRARRRSATTAAWACSSTCSASTTSRPGRRSGTPRAGASTRRSAARCASSRSGAATRRSTRRRSCTRSCGSSPGTGRSTATTCSWSRSRGSAFSLKPMNCPESTFVYRSRLRVVSRPAAAPVRVRRAAPQRAVGRAVRPHARPPLRHRRRPHLRATGPDRLGDRGADGRDPRGVRLVRPDADPHVRHAARQGARRPGRVGRDRGDHAAPSSTAPASSTGSRRRTARSMRPRSTSRSRTPWAGSGRRRPSRSTA